MQKAFIIFLAYLPLQVALNIYSGIDLASGRIFCLALFIFFLGGIILNKKIEWKVTIVDFFLLVFLFFMSFSVIFSQNYIWSLRKIVFLFSLFPVYVLTRSLIQNKDSLKKSLSWIVGGGVIVASVGLFQFLSQFIFGINSTINFWSRYILPIFSGNSFSEAIITNPAWLVNISGTTVLRAFSFFPDPHMFSFFLNIIIGFCLAIIIMKKKMSLVWVVSFLILLIADFLTFSRGGYLAFLCAFIFISFYLVFTSSFPKIKYFILLIFLSGAVFLTFSNPVSERLVSSFNLSEGSNMGRIETWEKAGSVIVESSFLGVGIGNYPLHINSGADYRDPIYAHSNYLDIILDGGIISLLAWLGAISGCVLVFLKKSKKNLLFIGLLFSLISFSVHSFFETSLYSVVIYPYILFILGLSSVKIEE